MVVCFNARLDSFETTTGLSHAQFHLRVVHPMLSWAFAQLRPVRPAFFPATGMGEAARFHRWSECRCFAR